MNTQRRISLSLALAAAAFAGSFAVSANAADAPANIVFTCPVSRMPVTALPGASEVGRLLGKNTGGSSDARLKALLKLAGDACKRGAEAVALVAGPEEFDRLASR